jgi:hypothetical protein
MVVLERRIKLEFSFGDAFHFFAETFERLFQFVTQFTLGLIKS